MTEAESSNGLVLDIDSLVYSLTRLLGDAEPDTRQPRAVGRIRRIPETLREIDVRAYEPIFLSIGPYHHGKPALQEMEKSKLSALRSVLNNNPERTLRDYIEAIKDIEPQARSFYSNVEMSSEEFLQMLLLDGLYIITTFCGMPKVQEREKQMNERMGSGENNADTHERANQTNEGTGSREDTNVGTANGEDNEDKPVWIYTHFAHDIFLLENQLPFFLLQRMHSFLGYDPKTPLLDIMKAGVGFFLSDYSSGMSISPNEKVYHLLHLCHMFFRPTHDESNSSANQLCCIPPAKTDPSNLFRLRSAVQLYDAGVMFRSKTGPSNHSLLDVTLGNCGRLVMPRLHVDDNTNSLLRNLIALEQMMHPTLKPDVSAYVVFLVHLIKVPQDVELLLMKGIIAHHLGSDKEMSTFINRISLGLNFDYDREYSLKPVFQKLRRFPECRVHRWRAWLVHRYFNNPWLTVGLIAASLLLLLSALQTFYTVYPYYHNGA